MISSAELDALMKSDTPHAVLDLRERGAYQKRHIFRATSLPRRLLEQRLPLLVPALSTPIVLCDDTSALSALSVPTLRAIAGGPRARREGRQARGRRRGRPFVSPDKVKALLARRDRENVYILDVRTSEEYAASHIAGAVWAPGGQAVQATDEYVAVHEATVVLACDGFARSVMTAAAAAHGISERGGAGGRPRILEAVGRRRRIGPSGGGPWGLEAARRHVATCRPPRSGRAGAQRGHERRLRARPRAGRGVDLPEPARARGSAGSRPTRRARSC